MANLLFDSLLLKNSKKPGNVYRLTCFKMYAILNHKSQPDHLFDEQIAMENHD